MKAKIYIEGGGDDKFMRGELRASFNELFKRSGIRPPALVASGSRENTFKDFKKALLYKEFDFIGLLVDSEEPVRETDRPWEHLLRQDRWVCPEFVKDEQVFLMTTSMETWIFADRNALQNHFGKELLVKHLPNIPALDLEKRSRQWVKTSLDEATKNCRVAYRKGEFKIIGKLNPEALMPLPAFARMIKILREKLR